MISQLWYRSIHFIISKLESSMWSGILLACTDCCLCCDWLQQRHMPHEIGPVFSKCATAKQCCVAWLSSHMVPCHKILLLLLHCAWGTACVMWAIFLWLKLDCFLPWGLPAVAHITQPFIFWCWWDSYRISEAQSLLLWDVKRVQVCGTWDLALWCCMKD